MHTTPYPLELHVVGSGGNKLLDDFGLGRMGGVGSDAVTQCTERSKRVVYTWVCVKEYIINILFIGLLM